VFLAKLWLLYLSPRLVKEFGTQKVYWSPANDTGSVTDAAKCGSSVDNEQALKKLQEQVDSLKWVEEAYSTQVQGHIERLHEYNEVKDTTQELLGRLAMQKGTTTTALYQDYGLDSAL